MKKVANKARLLLFALAWVACVQMCRAQTFQDYFTNRQTFTAASGSLNGNNTNATIEPNEPLHGGKPGGHSVWISWLAPTNGVARFKTETSGFDTLISAYHFNSTNDTTLDKLVESARNDDSEELDDRESEIEFGVLAGQRYEIAVDGYYGAVGRIEFAWRLDPTANPPPTILSTTPDTTLQVSNPITLTVVLTNVPSGTKFQWFFNGAELLDQKSTNMSIASMQVTNVGRYKLQIDLGSQSYFARSTELQINTEGASALAQGKLPDSPGTKLLGNDGTLIRSPKLIGPGAQTPKIGVVLGYNGSQIFNTTFATTDPAEPIHCSTVGGSSYWLTFQPPANGTFTVDSVGSTYDTVMEVYSYNVPPASYQDLISLACDHDSIPGGSRVRFAVTKTRQYVVAVAGVNGAKGTAYLNYSLNTNQLPAAPVLTGVPSTMVVTNGANVTLVPPIAGSPPMRFTWSRDAVPVTNSYSPGLSLPNVTPSQTGNYLVTVTNDLGSASAQLPLHVVVPPTCSIVQTASDSLQMSLPTQIGMHYTVEQAADMSGPWQSSGSTFIGDGQTLNIPLPITTNGFYRVRIE